MLDRIAPRLAQELNARVAQVLATITLLDEGATVPFIARYRKEVTGGLDDTQLRLLAERLVYLRELEQRRDAVLDSIAEQGKLSAELRQDILAADSKQRLEDLYLPYKPKRRTRAQIAREAGLEPLAQSLLQHPEQDPDSCAAAYVNAERGVADVKAALDGARHILLETFAEDATLVGQLRDAWWQSGVLIATVVAGQEEIGAKFADYFAYSEDIRALPSHRALALFRGRNENVLSLALKWPQELVEGATPQTVTPAEPMIAARFGIQDKGRPADKWLKDSVRLAWRAKIALSLELELFGRVKESAEGEAIRVFGRNLRDLLLAAPAGMRATMGLDPGLRTGVKVAVVDSTGKLLDTAVIYPHAPQNAWAASVDTLAALARKHQVQLISIGNGTASRETDKLAQEVCHREPELKLQTLVVSEAGASVYSASELAAREFPHLDVSLRGAVSIARRLQDPLAELVKIDPKAIGVGQYQHDVNQNQMAQQLDTVVEDCVNAVGVDVNTASVPLLARVSGLNPGLAQAIVAHRDAHGAFGERRQLLQVPRLGPKTFELAAGFLRIAHGQNPLDASAVHPEAYPVVERILANCGKPLHSVLGNSGLLKQLKAEQFTDERFGLPTVRDILLELEKPGRDPRPEFKTATFREGVETLNDLEVGMVLEGVVTNVTNFGAFVDIGVHQDGLVHISMLANSFVKDPHSVVKAGQVVKVKVLEVDVKRRRVALSMRMDAQADPGAAKERPQALQRKQKEALAKQSSAETAMAAAFAKLRKS